MKAHHTLVTGSSGGGKTTLLREMHANFDGCSIFLTTKKNERKAESDPPRRVRRSSCEYPADIEKAREWAHKRPEACQIIVDECQQSGLAEGHGPLVDGLHEDRESRIKWVPATQSPQDLSEGYTALQQCRYIVWVGRTMTFHKGFMNYYGLNDIDFPNKDYHYLVIEPTHPPEVHGPFKTKEKYS